MQSNLIDKMKELEILKDQNTTLKNKIKEHRDTLYTFKDHLVEILAIFEEKMNEMAKK